MEKLPRRTFGLAVQNFSINPETFPYLEKCPGVVPEPSTGFGKTIPGPKAPGEIFLA